VAVGTEYSAVERKTVMTPRMWIAFGLLEASLVWAVWRTVAAEEQSPIAVLLLVLWQVALLGWVVTSLRRRQPTDDSPHQR